MKPREWQGCLSTRDSGAEAPDAQSVAQHLPHAGERGGPPSDAEDDGAMTSKIVGKGGVPSKGSGAVPFQCR